MQTYLVFLIGVMIISGIMKKHNLLADVFKFISEKIKSKRAVVAIISLIGGILPIPGRVIVSAGILSNLSPCCSVQDCNSGDKDCRKARAKFGIIDYLSTHHYYLWSPLEKTVILPMAVLGIGWATFISIIYPLIIISILYIVWYVFWKLNESDIRLNLFTTDGYNIKRFITGFLPLMSGIVLLGFNYPGEYIFGVLTFYYIILTKTFDIKELISYVNWWMVIVLSLVMMLSVFFSNHSQEILNFIKTHNTIFDITTITGMIAISGFAFISSWLMGSSGKFAGIVALLVSIYGVNYLVWFLVLEFFAYNISPSHKCIPIGSMYFGTPIRRYFEAIIYWQFLLLSYGFITTFIIG